MTQQDIYELITETVPEFFFVWSVKDKKIIFVSPKFYELAAGDNTPPHDEGDLLKFIDPAHYEEVNIFFDSLSEKNHFQNKIQLKTSEIMKEVNWIEIDTFPVKDNTPEVELVVGHMLDITDKKERITLLEDENQNFDEVLKMLSHDLRQPFTQINVLTELTKHQWGAADQDKAFNYLNKIKDACVQANNLLNSFLKLAIVNFGEHILATALYDLRQIIKDSATDFDNQLTGKSLAMSFDFPAEEVQHPVDRSLFGQAIKNLISNAIKFTPNGGKIIFKIKEENHVVYVLISDTGIGIPKKMIPDLFKQFTRSKRVGLEGEKPIGLGLAIAKKIIDMHMGEIVVESEEGDGTTFIIKLPKD